MPLKANTLQRDFAQIFARFLSVRDEESQAVGETVSAIIKNIRHNGDKALLGYTKQFDRFEATHDHIRVTPEEIANAISLCQPELITSLKVASARIRDYSQR